MSMFQRFMEMEARESIARKPPVGGVYLIRNGAKGAVYIGSSPDPKAELNRHRHLLEHSAHPIRQLQSDWNSQSGYPFNFEVAQYCYSVIRLRLARLRWRQLFIDELGRDFIYNFDRAPDGTPVVNPTPMQVRALASVALDAFNVICADGPNRGGAFIGLIGDAPAWVKELHDFSMVLSNEPGHADSWVAGWSVVKSLELLAGRDFNCRRFCGTPHTQEPEWLGYLKPETQATATEDAQERFPEHVADLIKFGFDRLETTVSGKLTYLKVLRFLRARAGYAQPALCDLDGRIAALAETLPPRVELQAAEDEAEEAGRGLDGERVAGWIILVIIVASVMYAVASA